MYEFYIRCLIFIWKAFYLYKTFILKTSAIKSFFRIFSFSFVLSSIENFYSCHRTSKVFFQKCSFSLSHFFLYIFIRIIEHRKFSWKFCHSKNLNFLFIQNDRIYFTTAFLAFDWIFDSFQTLYLFSALRSLCLFFFVYDFC